MSMVEMREYRRVVERCEQLEAELAWYRDSESETDRAIARAAIRRAVPGICMNRASTTMLALLIEKKLVRYDEPFEQRSQIVRACNARAAMRAAGFLGDPLICVTGVGHKLTEQARAWLRERVPEAFPKAGGKAP